MNLKKFKERDHKRIGIVVFTIACILLVCGAVLYRTFAIFEVNTNQNVINGQVQGMGDLEFAFYKDNTLVKEVPKKEEGYSLDTSSSYCIDLLNNQKVSNINWDNERWGPYLSNITTTKTKCYLYFKKIYQEDILNGAIPDLGNGRLIPVQIKEEQPTGITIQNIGDGSYGGKVEKADITDTWYSYKDKRWANAVILKDGVEDNYSPGQEIEEKDIEAYFVWIPRYSYKLQESEETYTGYIDIITKNTYPDVQSFYNYINGNKGETEVFDIQFETKNSSVKQGSQKGQYLTHPAFVSFDSNGLWVGKFETGYNQNNENIDVKSNNSWNADNAKKNEENSSKIIIKPNVYSWREIQVANAFYTSYNYQRDLESHMMKNTEWGAVAYLTQSIYGRCEENGICKEVRINNSSSYVTGMSAANAPTCGFTATRENCNWYETTALNIDSKEVQSYYNKNNKEASTTGNYTGIYDMAGGAWEYVMGVMHAQDKVATPTSGRSSTYNSGFKGPYSCSTCDGASSDTENKDGKPWPSSKYYDLYDYDTTDRNFYRGKLGDGTKEVGPFYSVAYQKPSGGNGSARLAGSYNADVAFFVDSYYPWFRRGALCTDGTEAGLSAFINSHGQAYINTTFRIVLTP